jgi:hypothetical protein
MFTPSTAPPSRPSTRRRALVSLLAGAALLGSPAAIAAAAPRHAPVASVARTQTRALMAAAHSERRADRRLVSDARALARCRRAHPGHCQAQSGALQKAGRTYAASQRHLSSLARSTSSAKSSSWHGYHELPKLTASGDTLSWNKVEGAGNYVLAYHVSGLQTEYMLVTATTYTPPAVPGASVTYSVRSANDYSGWSNQVTISYPKTQQTEAVEAKAEEVKASEPSPPKTPEAVAAPQLTVSGQTLTWNAIAGTSTYVLATIVPGKADQYTEVSGTSFAPPAVPGTTVRYSLRTAVEGSAWSTEVAITFPAEKEPEPARKEVPPVEESHASGPFEMGIVSGSAPLYELQFISAEGARTARVEFNIQTSAAEMESSIAAFAKDGIRVTPLAIFDGTLPTPAQAQNVATWAARFGPGGSFWQGKSYPAGTAVTKIEFGNETSYSYQYSENSTSAYATRAQTYALRFKEAAVATAAANPGVGVLAQGDPGNGSGTAWMDNMFKAVPNLGQYVAGWTVHPYGPGWQTVMDKVVSSAAADGAPSSIPLYVTEWGLSTDNGRCLDSNYGWNTCMTYAEAATTLSSVVSAMRARYGSRLASLYLYQAHDQAATGTATGREYYFGALQSNGSPKGAYTTTVESLLHENP